jgi:DNA invertase Pin-like site-specific DNA recombinase
VFAIEASRLARNGRDWHTLIEFCGLVGTILIDEDGIYDARHPNDRLLLGMKGTMSELELSLFRQRSQEALKQKARRGALFLGVAAGYVVGPCMGISKSSAKFRPSRFSYFLCSAEDGLPPSRPGIASEGVVEIRGA